jgi:hypothetical protein
VRYLTDDAVQDGLCVIVDEERQTARRRPAENVHAGICERVGETRRGLIELRQLGSPPCELPDGGQGGGGRCADHEDLAVGFVDSG